ncbi:MAG: phosphatidylserine decarboxylase [Phycisphaerae bacterium]|nr:phosphatidylserine decarboxylase [Phycisphaerae bacterium]
MTITRDGLREILIATASAGVGGAVAAWAALAVSAWFWALAVPLWVLWIWTIAFFRDPHRAITADDGLLVSPADGKVTEIRRLDGYEAIGGPVIRIGIFLSVFDVHINRAPCAGRVLSTEYRPGGFLDARHPESGLRNESNTLVIEPVADVPGPIVVRQIAGFLARRIVCHVKPGDSMERGQRLGMLKFGSRTELIVPADCGLEPAVRVNDHVKGGATVLMKAPSDRRGQASTSSGRQDVEASNSQELRASGRQNMGTKQNVRV